MLPSIYCQSSIICTLLTQYAPIIKLPRKHYLYPASTIGSHHYRQLKHNIFFSTDLPSGTHKVTVTSAGKDFGTTTIEVESDIDRFIEFLHKTVRYDAITLLAKLLRTHTDSKEDVESELVDIIAETSHSPPFLRLLENLVQLEPKAGKNMIWHYTDKTCPSALWPGSEIIILGSC